ncbi:MAG: LamG domain-containing protein [Pseudomonadota bacterium]
MTSQLRFQLLSAPTLALLLATLVGCSAGSGGGGTTREVDLSTPVGSQSFVYSGPPPASQAIQDFKVAFYDQLAGDDRCGECHTPGKSGTTHFVDQGDVNTAWQQARTVVNLDDPASSAVVARVASGHNCWLGPEQSATCATTITSYIERWADSTDDSPTAIELLPRRALAPSGTRVLPADIIEVNSLGIDLTAPAELLDLTREYCADCHSDTAPIAQVPFFASADDEVAFAALRGKIDLITPSQSRLVLRLDPESHNCWSDCASNAADMEWAIDNLAAVIPITDVDPSLLISTAAVLENDGLVATTGGRYDSSLIAKWEFREGSGNTTADTSGVPPEIPLTLSGDYGWQAGWGIRFQDGKAQGGVNGSSKLFNMISGVGEYSIEVWVAPANVTQEEAWIVGYAGGPESVNMLLRQSLYNYEAFTRSTVTDDNNAGAPALVTNDDAQLAQASLQHVVVTYSPIDGRKIYVNGEFSGDVDAAGGGLLNNWSEAFALVLGNSTSGTNPWAGVLRMAALHNSALTPEQVFQNFDVGVGQKYYLMFSIAEIIDRAGVCHVMNGEERVNYCYVVFEVSQFDDASYLFNEPFFVNINPDGGEVDFDLTGIRLGVNGKIARIGQAFTNVNARISGNEISVPRYLAEIGSIVPLENGGDQDIFFLAFDNLSGVLGESDDGSSNPFQAVLTGEASSDVGVRTFDEINASLSRLTGVSTSSPSVSPVTGKTVAETYAIVRRALPGVADFQTFMSSHHMAATQLTAAYCDALVQDVALREQLFPAPPTFDFSTPVASPSIDWRAHVVTPLVDRAINRGLLTEAERNQILDEVELLITDDRDLKPYVLINGQRVSDPNPAAHNKRDGLIYCENDALCPPSRTAEVVKAACTAVFGSAVVLMQ